MTALVLLDSDAARKLCQYQLLSELAKALQCSFQNLAVLPQLRFQLRLADRQAAIKKLGSEEAFAQALDLVQNAKAVEVQIEYSNRLLVLDRPDIDSGEAVLFAALVQHNDAQMISGDKRAFVALSKINGEPLLDTLWVRFMCLEEALLIILDSEDFDQVSTKVRARADVDKALNLAFGRSAAAERASVRSALSSYIGDLKKDTCGKYLHPTERLSGCEIPPAGLDG